MSNLTKTNTQVEGFEKIIFTEDQLALIKVQIAPKANPAELALFLNQCKRTGLDPLSRQIYCIHLGGKMTIQTSIDGFRVIAERSGDYAGQDEPAFKEEGGRIISCTVIVYRFRGDKRYPAAVGVAYLAEYNAGGQMWNKMPHTMLAKCAEAQALRKAYPQDLSGLYTMDEMDQANKPQQTDDVHHEVVAEEVKITEEQWQDEINGCNDLTALGAFYRSNKATADANKNIMDMLAVRKIQLTKTTEA